MAIHFDEFRWKAVRAAHDAWWAQTLERPLIDVKLIGLDPGREQPDVPLLSKDTSLDFTLDPDALIDRLDYELSRVEFLGDAYPYIDMDVFGPGVLAGFLGANAVSKDGIVWFYTDEQKEIQDLHFTYQPDNPLFNRVKEVYRAGNRRWHGNVVMSMVDMGGVMDVLAVFRGTENLMMDMYDNPDEVKRAVQELHDLWIRYYNELNDIIDEEGHAHSDWGQLLSTRRNYIIQSDFSFMIGNDMFNEFVKDELAQYTEELDDVIYHLDGPGELKHLDSLLSIPRLKAVQWIPGVGVPDMAHWPEVYQKIHAAGKNIQLFGDIHYVRAVAKQIGTYKGIHFHDFCSEGIDQRQRYVEIMNEYGLEIS